MIKIASFWKKTSKNDRTYYQGKLGDGKLLLFKNENKASDKHPDLNLFLVTQEPEKKEGERPESGESDVPF